MKRITVLLADGSQSNFRHSRFSWRIFLLWSLSLLSLLAIPCLVEAQYTYTTNTDNTLTITGYTGVGGTVTIPTHINGLLVTCIGDESFGALYGNTCVTSLTIPDSVTSIGNFVFDECMSVTDVTFGDGVTNIGSQAFDFCYSLNAITVAPQNSFYSGVDGILFDKNQTTLVCYPAQKAGTYAIPAGVTSIGISAFRGCGRLTGVTIPDSVTSIPSHAFYFCTGLTSVTIPDSVTNIGLDAFFECSSLTNITIPGSVTSIEDYAFLGCTSLSKVTIGAGVRSIGHWAFSDCNSLAGVYFEGNAPSVDPACFDGVYYATVYYLPDTTGWNTTFGGLPTALGVVHNPLILNSGPSFGVRTNGFGFSISWATNIPVVVEASTNLANPTWSPLATNTLTSGSFYFSDPQWTNYSGRFYRLRSP